jgi:hypothetical protein
LLLKQVPLPQGARRLSGEPSGDGHVLAGTLMPILPDRVDVRAFWQVPMAATAVAAFVDAHHPAGSSLFLSGSGTAAGGRGLWNRLFTWPPLTNRIGDRILGVEVTALNDGSAGVRADALVKWSSPVLPASVTRSTRLLRVTARIADITPNRTTFQVRRFLIRTRRRIGALAALLNALPPFLAPISCPGEGLQPIVKKRLLVRLQVALYGRHPITPLARVDINGGGFCGYGATVMVTLAGAPARYSFSSKAFRPIVAALGLKIRAQLYPY